MNPTPPDARLRTFEELAVGVSQAREYAVTPAVLAHFHGAFDDRNPMHVDEEYARARGFPGRLMHGAILHGFLSHFVGMEFPGKLSLLLAVEIRYSQPFFLDDVLRLEARVAQRVDSQRVVVLGFTFQNLTREWTTARAKVQVKILEPA